MSFIKNSIFGINRDPCHQDIIFQGIIFVNAVLLFMMIPLTMQCSTCRISIVASPDLVCNPLHTAS